MMETISYYVIVATAGHDTTASAMAGGLHALIEHPDQLARLKADPSLIPTAVDEIIRWVTPVKHFMRNCVTPYEVRGHPFEPGDAVLLSYPSANRDEEVFADPFRFDVGRPDAASTSPSASACTTAWARTSPDSKYARSFRNCSVGWTRSNWPERRPSSTRRWLAGPRPSRCVTGSAEPRRSLRRQFRECSPARNR